MTKHELFIALMALPDDAEIMVPDINEDVFVPVEKVMYFDKTEDNSIWLSGKDE